MPGTYQSAQVHKTAQTETKKLRWASEMQKEAFEYGPAPQLLSGGFGSSKTWCCSMKALWLSDVFPRNRGVILRKVYEELTKTTMATFFKICPREAYNQGGRRVDSGKYLRFNNGSEILWMYTKDLDEATTVIKGLEINWFFFDQIEECEEETWDLLMGRLGRWDQAEVPDWILKAYHEAGRIWPWKYEDGRPSPPTYAMGACNPDTELHWLYRRFHPDSSEHWEDRGKEPSYAKQGYKMFTMNSLDNVFLTKDNRSKLSNQDESYVRRYVRGEWGMPEGKIHQVRPESEIEGTPEFVEYLKRTCTLHMVLDHGDSAPTCVTFWAVDKQGNMFLWYEYYEPNLLVSQHRRNLFAITQNLNISFRLADPAIFHKTQQKYGGRWSVSDDYLETTIEKQETSIPWEPADNNEMMTRGRINEFLAIDPNRIHPVTKERGSPTLFFVKKSKTWPHGALHSLAQTKGAVRVKVGTSLGKPVFSDDRNEDIPDHAYDTVRYFVASRPPSSGILGVRSRGNTFNAVLEKYRKQKKAGLHQVLAREARREARSGRFRR